MYVYVLFKDCNNVKIAIHSDNFVYYITFVHINNVAVVPARFYKLELLLN